MVQNDRRTRGLLNIFYKFENEFVTFINFKLLEIYLR